LYLTIGTGGHLITLQMKQRAFVTAFDSTAGGPIARADSMIE
jgi:hypothetical protein